MFARILLVAAAAATLALAGTASADWTQYRGDAARSGRALWTGPGPSVGTAAPRGEVLWFRALGQIAGNGERPINGSAPIIGPDGSVYLGVGRRGARQLYAYGSDGSLRWTSRLEGYSVYGTPALHGSRLLVVGDRFDPDRQRVFRVNARDGSIEARTAQTDSMGGSPLAGGNGDAFYRDGDAVWRLPANDHRSTPRPILAARHVYDLTGGPGLGDFLSNVWEGFSKCFPGCSFDQTGYPGPPYPVGRYLPSPALSTCGALVSPLREYLPRTWIEAGRGYETKTSAISTPAVGQSGRAYLGLEDRYLAAYGDRGQQLWKHKWVSQPVSVAIGHEATDGPVTDQCVSAGRPGRLEISSQQRRYRDRLFVLLADGRLAKVDAETGRSRWAVQPGQPLVGEPVVVSTAQGEQVLVTARNRLYSLSPSDGHVLWAVPLDSPAYGSPAVADGRIYVATGTRLYAIR